MEPLICLIYFYFDFINLYVKSVLAGVGYGCSYTPPIQALIEWFPDKRGLASGVVIAGFGSGALFFTPAMNALMQKVSISWLPLCTTTLKENYPLI